MNWKTKTLLIYGIGGLILGVMAGIISINNAVENNKTVDISLQDGAKIGMNALNAMQKLVIK